MSDRRRWLLVAVGALALALSYPPFPLPILSFVAIVPAVLLLEDAGGDAGRAYTWGVRYGIAANGLVLSWMVVALWHFTPLAALGYVITSLVLGVFTGILFWFVVRVRGALPRVPLAVVFPVAWTALEWAVGHLGDVAFPWLGLGTSLADARVLVQWADLVGARGVTVWVVWVNVLAAGAVLAWGNRRLVAFRLLPVALSMALVAVYGVWRERTLPVHPAGTVALVQPNVASGEKWEANPDSQVATLLAMSQEARAAAHIDLFLWPESALPGWLPQQPVVSVPRADYPHEPRGLPVGARGALIGLTAYHTRGHVVFVEHAEKAVFAGDVLFAGSIGRTDLLGGDYDTLIASIQEQLLSLPDEFKVYPGHGPPTTIGAERQFNPFL